MVMEIFLFVMDLIMEAIKLGIRLLIRLMPYIVSGIKLGAGWVAEKVTSLFHKEAAAEQN